HVVSLLGERLHEPNVMVEPVPAGIVLAVSHATVVVAPVAEVDPDRLLAAGQNLLRERVPAVDVGKASYDAQHLPKGIGFVPRNHERGDRTRARATDPVLI